MKDFLKRFRVKNLEVFNLRSLNDSFGLATFNINTILKFKPLSSFA